VADDARQISLAIFDFQQRLPDMSVKKDALVLSANFEVCAMRALSFLAIPLPEKLTLRDLHAIHAAALRDARARRADAHRQSGE
jgi:hypothetical protein